MVHSATFYLRLFVLALVGLFATVPARADEKPASLEETPMPVASVASFLESQAPKVIAHRGFSGQAPENTLVAIRQAIEIGADMVEIDVTLTRDGHVIVLHDETLERTTDGGGAALETQLADIQKLDAGSWFDARYAGEKVPTLQEVLDLVTDRILLNIEIKHEAVTDAVEGGIAQKVHRLVAESGRAEQVIVSSFDPRPLARLRELGSPLATASLYAVRLHSGLLPSDITAQVGSVAFNVSGRHLDEAMLENAKAHGIPVQVYTVNEIKDMERLLEVGVVALFTDHPDRMLRLLSR
ncbi:MAG: glycerophosphodiester phosphodiesterase family protein [Acidobacteriota bacterium]